MIDLSLLFEPRRSIAAFKNLLAELNALHTGSKAMSVFILGEEDIGTQRYQEIVAPALALGLSVAHCTETFDLSDTTVKELRVFVFAPEQSWRLPAYLATRQIMSHGYEWSDGAEYLESCLLGYNEDQIAEWIKEFRDRRTGWRGTTFYLLLTDTVKKVGQDLGMRCLNPRAISEDIVVFYSREQRRLRNDAIASLPNGLTIARAAVKYSFFIQLFGSPNDWGESDVITSSIGKKLAVSFNSALESNLQIRNQEGWH